MGEGKELIPAAVAGDWKRGRMDLINPEEGRTGLDIFPVKDLQRNCWSDRRVVQLPCLLRT